MSCCGCCGSEKSSEENIDIPPRDRSEATSSVPPIHTSHSLRKESIIRNQERPLSEDVEKMYVLVQKAQSALPVVEMTQVIPLLPDSVKEIAQAILPIVTNASSVIPLLGPLPTILFKFCAAVHQAFELQEGRYDLVKNII